MSPPFQTVRGVFVKGGPAFEGAGISQKSHIAEEHRRAMDSLARMSREERAALLRRAGIVDDHGHLAAKYTSPGEPVTGSPDSK